MNWTNTPPSEAGLYLRGGPGRTDKVKIEYVDLNEAGRPCFRRWAGDVGQPKAMVEIASIPADLQRYFWLGPIPAP